MKLIRILATLILLVGCGSPDQAPPNEPPIVVVESGPVDVLVSGPNQSNGAGVVSGTVITGLPDPTIRYFSRELGATGGGFTAWDDLQLRTYTPTSHGASLALGRSLQAAGRTVAILELFKGGTFINQWIPGRANHTDLMLWTGNALALLPAEFPNATEFRFWVRTNQGEEEARSFEATVLLWRERHTTIYQTVVDKIHEYFPDAPVRSLIAGTDEHITGATNPGGIDGAALLHGEQIQAAADIDGLFVDQTGLETQGDGVHRTEAGYNDLGALEAAAILGAP